MRRYSKQREVIAENLRERYDHPSADMVYASVKETLPKISMGTVYRNLKEMTQAGEVISFMLDGRERFDGNALPHVHLCCDQCGSITDKTLQASDFGAYVDQNYQVQNIIIHGTCVDCQRKQHQEVMQEQ